MSDSKVKEIHSEADRAFPLEAIPDGESAEAFAADYTRKCEVCEQAPVVNSTGLCGPCTFGEAETVGGNW